MKPKVHYIYLFNILITLRENDIKKKVISKFMLLKLTIMDMKDQTVHL